MLRTHTCGELAKKDIGSSVTLCGWVDTRRDHGGLIFIDLRDRWGVTQLVFNPEQDECIHRLAESLRAEYLILARGEVRARPTGTENPKLKTGEIEVMAKELEILNPSPPPPFELGQAEGISEEVRLRHRFMDLRSPSMLKNLEFRYQVTKTVRDYFNALQFIEVETPYLTKSTPEGARDFLVPSRLSLGQFYALPQSPQLFKQILMVAGIDRYFQIVRCFRDEDLRADRQPEHTQIDVEMSFVNENDIMEVIEKLLVAVCKENLKRDVSQPFRRLTYQEAMERFGTDKPDLRFGLELLDATCVLRGSSFKTFESIVQKGGVIKGLRLPQGGGMSRKELDELTEFVVAEGGSGLVWVKRLQAIESPVKKYFDEKQWEALVHDWGLAKGDLALLVAGDWESSCKLLGALRLRLAKKLDQIPKDSFQFAWVLDFPLFEWNEEEKRIQSCHHPFTSPKDEDLARIEAEPLKVKAKAYDLILNGTEIGGGSIRIHKEETQKRVFKILGIPDKEAGEKFGFLLRALQYGAPPHGGIALGLDRLCAMLLGLDSIRDVIAFPKTQKGICPMSEAPSSVTPKQLKELHLTLLKRAD